MHKQQSRQQPVDRRSKPDRRRWECKHEFPYIDSHGTLVTEDRRKNKRRESLPLKKSANAR